MDMDTNYHVTPVNDLIDHEGNAECPCGPDVKFVDEDGDALIVPVVVHHSLDNREARERA